MSVLKRKDDEDDNFMLYLKNASEIVQAWPEWKQTVLGTANSSYALKHAEIDHEKQNNNGKNE
ncbi:MAG: hypothetical protein KAS32_16430 [Candidatus Peribacteraceae bacterium]|nr:hypothetical protein [Candidatus Peribacteraceae bacterium]